MVGSPPRAPGPSLRAAGCRRTSEAAPAPISRNGLAAGYSSPARLGTGGMTRVAMVGSRALDPAPGAADAAGPFQRALSAAQYGDDKPQTRAAL